jgi:hypothetical protein
MDRMQYQLSHLIKDIISDLQEVKKKDLPEFYLMRDELKRDVGLEFYNQWFKEALEI